MSQITTKDGTQIYYKDWGCGPSVVLCHGWPLNADAWESQLSYLASNGYRCVAHDRRGHGRSSQPWHGNERDTYADDLSELIDKLDLRGTTLVGHSTGGGEAARYIGRYSTNRVARVVAELVERMQAADYTITPNTFLVLTTRSVDVDVPGLPALLDTPAGYIGLIGSRRRWGTARQQLSERGVPDEKLERVRSPIGLELHAETPEEIAVSVQAEIIKFWRER